MDYSTLNLKLLQSLPVYKLPATYQLQAGSGNGCAGDPPGYPTYFTRCVYNAGGNTPRNAPQYVITYNGVHYIVIGKDCPEDKRENRLRRLWNPLPIDHARSRLWIVDTYQHLQHCYRDEGTLEFGRPGTLIYPVPDYKLETFVDDARFSDAYRQTMQEAVAIANRDMARRAAEIAIPDNHQAVVKIRSHYPEYLPEQDLIDAPPEAHVGQWWESEAEQPSEACCAKTQRWGNQHPKNGNWCQWCGRTVDQLTTAGA